MKQITILSLSMLFFLSCSKQNDVVPTDQNEIFNRDKNSSAGLDVGALHNELLEVYLIRQPAIDNVNYSVQLPIATEAFFDYLEVSGDFDSRREYRNYETEHRAFEWTLVNMNVRDGKSFFDNQLGELSSIEIPGSSKKLFSTKTLELLSEFSDILFDPSSTRADFKNHSDKISSYLGGSTTIDDLDRECLENVRSLFMGSTNYWFDEGVPHPEGFYQLDCIGYLAGWVSAVVSEIDSTGDLHVENENARIHQGVIWAAAGSCSWWL